MKLSLKTLAKEHKNHKTTLILQNRLPEFVAGDVVANCSYSVKEQEGQYLLFLKVEAQVEIICQRCLNLFKYEYFGDNSLLVCDTEEVAKLKINDYECIVAGNNTVVLEDILIDDLYLFLPDKHAKEACDHNFLEKYLN